MEICTKPRVSFEEILQRIRLVNKETSFKIISRDFKKKRLKDEHFYLQTEYGICKMAVSSLIRGSQPSIKSAVCQTTYFRNFCNSRYNFKKLRFNNSFFKGSLDYTEVNCIKHGPFRIRPNCIMSSNKGCKKCASETSSKRMTSNTKAFVKKAMERYREDISIFDKVDYINCKTPVLIFCKNHKDYYETTPNTYLNGTRCPLCANYNRGYSRSDYIKAANGKPSKIYLIETDEFFKVGITIQSVEKRFQKLEDMPYTYTIKNMYEGDPGVIYDLEKHILRTFHRFKKEPLIKFKGYTECFSKDLPLTQVYQRIEEFLSS